MMVRVPFPDFRVFLDFCYYYSVSVLLLLEFCVKIENRRVISAERFV